MTLQEYNDLYKRPMLKSMKIVSSGGVTITNTNIVSEEMSLEKSLCSEANLRFGRCESACFKIRIADIDHDFTREWLTVTQSARADVEGFLLAQDGKYLLTEDGQKIKLQSSHDYENLAKFGRFKVLSDKPDNDRRWKNLTCYDAMYDIINADVASWYAGLTFPMTIKSFRDSFFAYLGVSQESQTLINDNLQIEKGFSVDGTLSGKLVIEAICELNGVFGQITPESKFTYVSLPGSDSLTYDYYIDGTGSYEDYTTETITGIKAISDESDSGTIIGDTTNMYTISGNPLIYGLEGKPSLTTALTALLNKISAVAYMPFSVQTYGIPQLPLGTVVTLNTRNKTIVSYVISSRLTGIQSLRETISSKGDRVQPTRANNLSNSIMRQAGRIHKIVNDINELSSTIEDIDGNVSSITQTIDSFDVRIKGAEDAAEEAMAKTIESDTIHLLATDSNVTPSLDNPNWDVVTEISSTNKYLWSYHEYTYGNGTSSYTEPVITGRWGDSSSSSSIQYSLIVSAAAIAKNGSGAYVPASITLTGMYQTGTTAPAAYSGRFRIETTTNGTSWTTQYTSSTDEASKTYTVPANITAVRCTLFYGGGTTTMLDQQVVPVVVAGVDGYSVILTNENHTFAGNETSAIASSTDCPIIAYHGATQVAPTIGTITGQPTGMTTSISNNGTTSAKFTVTVTTDMVTKNGVLNVPVTVEGKTFNMKFTYSLSLKGTQGAKGDTGAKGDKGDKGDAGTAGANARRYDLIVSNSAIGKSASGVYNPSAITLTAKAQEGSSTPGNYSGRFRIETTTDNTNWTIQYTSSSNEYYKSYTIPTNISGLKAIRCSLYLAGGTSTLLDQQAVPIVTDGAKGDKGDTGATGPTGAKGDTGEAGKDAYTVILTNENHTFAGSTTAALASSAECYVVAYKGATQVAATIGTISGKPTGMTTSISNNGTTSAKFTVTVTTSMTTKNGVLTVPVTVDGKTFNMKFTFSLALKGDTGAKGDTGSTGTSIVEVVTLRYASSSSSAPAAPQSPVSRVTTTAGQWTKAIPDVDDTNKYMWTCDQIHYDKTSVGTNGYMWTAVVEDKAFADMQVKVNRAEKQIVLKVATSGQLVKAELGVDPDSSTSFFTVKAANISLSAAEAINLMAGGTINLTSKSITIDTTNHVFQVTSAGAVTCSNLTVSGGSINLGSGVFRVTNAGVVTCSNITATGGNIGGWKISDSELYKTYAKSSMEEYDVTLDATPTGASTKAISVRKRTKISSSDPAWISTYPFSVTYDGQLRARNLIAENTIELAYVSSETGVSWPSFTFAEVSGGATDSLVSIKGGYYPAFDIYDPVSNRGYIQFYRDLKTTYDVDIDASLTANKVNGCIFKAGTKVVTTTGNTSTAIFTNAQLNTLLGVSNSTNANTVVLAANGDGGAQAAHAEGCTYQNNTWYVTHDRNTASGNIRLNYLVFYWG